MSKLIVLRGNSGSGKSTVARRLRELSGRKIAIVSQDNVRREILKEKEADGGAHIALIGQIAAYALGIGYDVILEGILCSHRYAEMIETLSWSCAETYAYYFDVSLEETFRRHATKPNAHEFGEKEMREWFVHRDLLGRNGEVLIPEAFSLEQAADMVMGHAGLGSI